MKDLVINKNGSVNETAGKCKLVIFKIEDEVYGLDVMKIQEIIGIVNVRHIPDSVECLKGVINLRGMVVPVIDMRLRFRFQEKEYDQSTVILIVNSGDTFLGLIVDSVSDVLDIPIDAINEYNGMKHDPDKHLVNSIASYNDELVIILDTDRLMDDLELNSVSAESLAVSQAGSSL